MGSWTISQFDAAPSPEEWESMATHWMASGMMIGTFVISMLYAPVHKILLSKSSVYADELSHDQQTVVVTHVIEVIILSAVFVPYTYLILSINFETQDEDVFRRKATSMGTIMFSIVIMYLVEIAARHQHVRPLVLFHHLCAFADSILPGIFMSTANLRAASLLVYFITYEAITFVGLVMYRLWPHHQATRPVILTGMFVFGLSRPVQFVWILASLIATWKDIVLWQAIVQILLTCIFTAVQVYSLTIHYGMYKKCGHHHDVDDDDHRKASGTVAYGGGEDFDESFRHHEEDGKVVDTREDNDVFSSHLHYSHSSKGFLYYADDSIHHDEYNVGGWL